MYRDVAQMARVHGLGPWGREFESHHPDRFLFRIDASLRDSP